MVVSQVLNGFSQSAVLLLLTEHCRCKGGEKKSTNNRQESRLSTFLDITAVTERDELAGTRREAAGTRCAVDTWRKMSRLGETPLVTNNYVASLGQTTNEQINKIWDSKKKATAALSS